MKTVSGLHMFFPVFLGRDSVCRGKEKVALYFDKKSKTLFSSSDVFIIMESHEQDIISCCNFLYEAM